MRFAHTTAGLLAAASITLAAPLAPGPAPAPAPPAKGPGAPHTGPAPPPGPKRTTRCEKPLVRKEWYAR